MAKTVLDPPNANKPALSPRQRRQQPRQQGGGLINALSPQEWFQISSQFLNPENNFGSAALSATQGIQETRRNAQMQEREDQLWQRQEQAFEREDQQRQQLRQMQQSVSEFYRARGDEAFADALLQATPEAAAPLFANMDPNVIAAAERETEAHNMQMALGRAQIEGARAEAQAASIPGYGDPVRYNVPTEGGQTVMSYYEPDTPGRGSPMGVLPNGQVVRGDTLNQVMEAARREADRTSSSEEFSPDPVMRREYQRSAAAAENFGSGLQMLTDILVNRDNPEVIPGLAGRARQVVQGISSQVGGIFGRGTRLDENGIPTQLSAENIREEGMTAESAEEEAANVLSAARTLSGQISRNDLPAGFRQTAADVGVYRSLLTSTAFQLALAQNGGRITEQDFRNAWNSLTSSDPATALQQFRAQAELTANKIDAMHRTIFYDPGEDFAGYAPSTSAPTLYGYLGQMGTGGALGRQGVPGGSQAQQSGQADFTIDL